MAALPYTLVLLVLCFGASGAHRRRSDNERKVDQFISRLTKLESEIRAYPTTNSTSDRLERLEVLVNLLLEDVYNVRADQELLKRDIMGRLKEIEDKISDIQPPTGPAGWIQFMIADYYKDFRPVRNYTDDDVPKVHRDCREAYDSGWHESGVYQISPDNESEFDVFCDQESSNGGWVVIQRRVDGTVNFGRGWAEYRDGFGDVRGEFWIGNQKLHSLTAGRDTRLRVELQYLTDGFTELEYQEFWIDGESDNYRLHVSNFTGSDCAGDSLSYHDDQFFSTKDVDYDNDFGSCAAVHGGGWWYNSCTKANLNGVYTSQAQNGIFWKTWTGYSNTLKSVTMMVKGGDSHVNGSYVDGDLRLVHPNGGKAEGRLEMMMNDTWGSICDDSFDDIDALVACRQLGFANGTYKTTKIPGTGPIWLDELRCSPHHTRLLDCPHYGIGNHDCSHYEDAYIACHDTPEVNGSYVDGDLRLVHPSGIHTEGRLEIFLNNTWGSVCDDSFDNVDAMVACRQIGFPNGTYKTTKIPGTGPIWLDDLHCSPHHTRLLDCPHRGIGNHNCGHSEDAYIACHDSPDVNGSYVNGDLRLVHSAGSESEGRLEIMLNDTWGTICRDYFDNVDATVACKQLGFSIGTYWYTNVPGTGPIWLSELQCSSQHQRLLDCPHVGIGDHSCGHYADVYIACYSGPRGNGDLRLVHPTGNNTEGRLEMMLYTTWGTICDYGFDTIDAIVACRQLGFSTGTYLSTKIAGTGQIWLSYVSCSLSHQHLLDCPNGGIGAYCFHQSDVYIACYDTPKINGSYVNGDLRLVPTDGRKNEGRLEILLNNDWGTVCRNYFDKIDATVSCKQMGFTDGMALATKTPGTGPIWLSNLGCRSNQTQRLVDCPHRGIGVHSCHHGEDAYVACYDESSSRNCSGLRLVHPTGIKSEGRLEIRMNATWGTICHRYFDKIAATVVCRQLGFSSGMPQASKTQGTGPIWLNDVRCSSSHTCLDDCPHRGIGSNYCGHNQDAHVACYDGSSSRNCSELRLVHPNGCRTEGRLEILIDNTWGTICDDFFDNNDAMVACKQLGFANGMYLSMKLPGTGRIWLDELQCSSHHQCLDGCPHYGIGSHNCGHGEDVYIACYDGSSRENCTGGYSVGDGNLRLVHPAGCKTEGRLEMLWQEAWGSICNNNFDNIDATVACQQLGFAQGIRINWESAGVGEIWLDDVQCKVNDTSLMECVHKPIGTHDCGHQQDVHIACFEGSTKECCKGPSLHDAVKRSVRLVGGLCPDEGRLEIYHDNTWGTICNHDFGADEATVACRELGYHSGIPMKAPAPGAGTIWLDKLSCNTQHTSIEDCKTTAWGHHTCTHEQDVGVVCFGEP